MALTPEEKELSVQASFGDDIMKQREAAIAIEDIRYDEAPAEPQWTDVAPAQSTLEWKDIPTEGWTDAIDPNAVKNQLDPEVYNALPDEIRVGFGDFTFGTGIELSDKSSAFLVTMGEAMTFVPRGIKQIMNIDREEMQQASKAVAKLYQDEELRGAAIGGAVVGALVEPVGFMIPGGKAASAGKAWAKGAAIGGTYGAAGYVEKEQTRLGNTLLGGTVGAAINRGFHGVSNIFAKKASMKARSNLEKMELYWAQDMIQRPDAAAIANSKLPNPSIFPSQGTHARAALNSMPKDFSLIQARNLGGRQLNPPRNLEEAQFVVSSYGLDKTQSKLGNLVDRAIGITSTRIGNISEEVKGMIRRHDYLIKQENHDYLTKVTPFLKRYTNLHSSKLVPGNTAKKTALDKALLEGKFEVVEREMKNIGQEAVNEFQQFKSAMIELGGRAKTAGLIKELVHNYVPRYIKDPEKYMKEIGQEGRVYKGAVDAAIKKAEEVAQARGQKLSTEAKSSIIHRAVFGSRSHKAPRSSFTYERKLKTIPDYLVSHYSPPEEAVHSYIRNTISDIHKRNFFGKHIKTLKLDDEFKLLDVDKSATNFVKNTLPHLTGAQRKELTGLLQSRFGAGEKAPMGWLQDIKNMTYTILLGNPVAAATQLGDLGVSMYINGFRNTMKGVLQSIRVPFTEKTLMKKKVTVKDWGVLDQLAEEFATTRQSARWVHRMFKYSGFQYVDRLGKDTFVNAAYLRLQKMPREQFMKKYAKELGADADRTFDELLGGEITPRVKAMLFSKLADVQPISPSEVPQAYLNNPNGRVVYMFKTFMLKQVDVIRQTGMKELKKGNYGKGMKELMSYGIIMGSSGLASQDVKSLMLGKDINHDDLPVEIGMNLFKTFGWSSYTLDQIKQGNYTEAATDQMLPPYEIFDKIASGDPRMVPLVGQIWYQWFGGGIEEYAAKQRKAKLDKAREPVTAIQEDIKEMLE